MKCVDQPLLYNSIKKYGWTNHTFEIIKECAPEELDFWEIYFMAHYDSTNRKKGLNIKDGGGHAKHTEETKAKMRLKRALQKPPLPVGWKPTPEMIEKVRNSKIGKPRPQYVKDKISQARTGKFSKEDNGMFGKTHSEEARSRISLARMKPVKQLTMNGDLIQTWPSPSVYKLITGKGRNGIYKCCKGLRDSYQGFRWEYVSPN